MSEIEKAAAAWLAAEEEVDALRKGRASAHAGTTDVASAADDRGAIAATALNSALGALRQAIRDTRPVGVIR